MEEFFSHAINPEELKTKIVNGRTNSGRDLLKYFEVYVERFNSDELPKPIDLVQATAKATDSNLVHHLKVCIALNFFFNLNEIFILFGNLKEYLLSKSF
jgi:hypothetical protein